MISKQPDDIEASFRSKNIKNERTAELEKLNEELKREVRERKRTEAQLEQRNRLLATLLDVSNIVSSTLELKPLMETILDMLKTIIEYKDAKIFAIEGQVLKVIAYRSCRKEEQSDNYSLDIDAIYLIKELIKGKKPIVIPDIMGDYEFAHNFREAIEKYDLPLLKSVRSWMGIPLIIKDRVLGILTVGHEIPDFYLLQHVSFGMAFANQAAIEFENARLYKEATKKADELKVMLAVQQAITSRLEKSSVLQLIADESRRLTNCERTAVFMVEGEELVLSVFSGKDSRRFLGYKMPAKLLIEAKGRPVIVNDIKSDEAIQTIDIVGMADVKSFLGVALMAENRPIGMIAVVDKIAGGFTWDDERILSLLASSAVIGLENSRLYEEEQLRHMEDESRRRVAEGLRDILKVLNSDLPLNEILKFIVDQALHFLRTDTGALYRLDREKGVLNIEASVGLTDGFVDNVTIHVGKGAVGQAVAERKPIVIRDIESVVQDTDLSDESYPYLRWLEENYEVMLAVPLVCMDEIYGGIVLYYSKSRSFSNDDIELAMTFADQAALAIDNAKLRAQSQEVAVAAERSRLARDLHDSVTQTLFSASLIAEVLPKIWSRNESDGKKRLEELRHLTRGALAEMRTLLLELRPATLVEMGLKELLIQLTQAFTGRSRMPVNLSIELQTTLPPDVKINLYRITQEALNNIVKHSRATKVDLTLIYARETGKLELTIKDNGRGFEKGKVSGDHLGLGIMKERAEAIGANIEVESSKGEGTEIIVVWRWIEGDNKNG